MMIFGQSDSYVACINLQTPNLGNFVSQNKDLPMTYPPASPIFGSMILN